MTVTIQTIRDMIAKHEWPDGYATDIAWSAEDRSFLVRVRKGTREATVGILADRDEDYAAPLVNCLWWAARHDAEDQAAK